MSTSNWQNISYNIDLIKRLDPKTILDIGIGYGRWGMLLREFLEVWGDGNFSAEWKRTVDGVEIFADYIKPYHRHFYNEIHIGDALKFLENSVKKYDLIICGDVLEHFIKEDAFKVIDLCLSKGKYVMINIPVGTNWKQGPVNGNDYERHRSEWTNSDFKRYDNRLIKKFQDVELRDFSVILLSKGKIDLDSAYGKHFKMKSILKNKLGLSKAVEISAKRKKSK